MNIYEISGEKKFAVSLQNLFLSLAAGRSKIEGDVFR